jgi:hypothetical protein
VRSRLKRDRVVDAVIFFILLAVYTACVLYLGRDMGRRELWKQIQAGVEFDGLGRPVR